MRFYVVVAFAFALGVGLGRGMATRIHEANDGHVRMPPREPSRRGGRGSDLEYALVTETDIEPELARSIAREPFTRRGLLPVEP